MQEIHFIDYYENSGEAITHYVDAIKKKPYIYDLHFAPHDIATHEYSTGFSRLQVASSLGINFIVLRTKAGSFEDGIESARSCFAKAWFDERNCSQLIKCLENYRKEWDERNLCYKNKAVHDRFSHGADAFRYACMAIKANYGTSSESMSDEKATALYEKHFPRFE